MGWESRVEFKGLTAMIMDLQGRAKKTMPLTSKMTKGLNDATYTLYVQNLSGSVPSTAAQPLPVGVRSGTLRSNAKRRMINQYSFMIENETFYAGFIEEGTRHLVPRRPLGNAVDQIQNKVPGEMGATMTKIWKT